MLSWNEKEGKETDVVDELDDLLVVHGAVGERHLHAVRALLDHAERLAKGQVRDDVERQVVEPLHRVQPLPLPPALPTRTRTRRSSTHLVHAQRKVRDARVHERRDGVEGLDGERVRREAALRAVHRVVARGEHRGRLAHERVVEVALRQRARALVVHDVDRGGVRDGDMSGRDAHEVAVFLRSALVRYGADKMGWGWETIRTS